MSLWALLLLLLERKSQMKSLQSLLFQLEGSADNQTSVISVNTVISMSLVRLVVAVVLQQYIVIFSMLLRKQDTGLTHSKYLMDPGLFNRKTSVSSGRPQHLKHYHTEHRCPTGLCAQLAALHAADPRLHCQVQLQPHHQVCWWHISGMNCNNDERHYREEVAQLAE